MSRNSSNEPDTAQQASGVPISPLTGTPRQELPQNYQTVDHRSDRPRPIVEITRDDWQNELAWRLDLNELRPPNRFESVARKHKTADYELRYLNPQQIDNAGTRGWEPIESENGGQVVVNGQILSRMPTDIYQKIEARKVASNLADIQYKAEQHHENQARLARDSNGVVQPMPFGQAEGITGLR